MKRRIKGMEERKYEKYFVTECTKPRPDAWGPVGSGSFNMWRVEEMFPQSNISGSGVYFTKPHLMVNTTHVHDCDEHLFFLGTNFEDMNDFDAEIELYMGEEGEKHIITSPTIVYVPAKMIHCPLNFAKVNKPVFFFHTRNHSVDKKTSPDDY
jgi:hypothetical protein